MAASSARSHGHGASAAEVAGDPRPVAPAGAAGQVPDFAALFRELAPYVLRVLPRMGVVAADIDDVAQEVFFAVHRGLPAFAGRSSVKTWVYGICIRTCSNHRQRAYRRRERAFAAPPDAGHAHSPERALEANRALIALDAALDALPEPQRAVFVLFEIEQLAIAQIAEALACSRFTAYARLYAARRAVQAAMRAHAHDQDGEP